MIVVCRKIAQILSWFVFFILLLVGIFSRDNFALSNLSIIVLKAFIGYVIFWLLGLIISDIILKTFLVTMENKKEDDIETGLASRFTKDNNEEYNITHSRSGKD